MISPNELRIGNWVRTDLIEEVVDVLCDSINTQRHNGLPYRDVFSIPLTEDWLNRFGFKKMREDRPLYKMKNFGKFIFHDTGIAFYPAVGINLRKDFLKHVHQLQNLFFALTGEELTINQP